MTNLEWLLWSHTPVQAALGKMSMQLERSLIAETTQQPFAGSSLQSRAMALLAYLGSMGTRVRIAVLRNLRVRPPALP